MRATAPAGKKPKPTKGKKVVNIKAAKRGGRGR
jgi:hypothetical protein